MKVKNEKPCIVNVWTGAGHESVGPGAEAEIDDKWVSKFVDADYLVKVPGKPGRKPKYGEKDEGDE